MISKDKKWYPRPDLNRHEPKGSTDFKSVASTYSATWASTMSNSTMDKFLFMLKSVKLLIF